MAGMAGGQKTSSGYITLQDDLLFGIFFDPITLFGSDGAQVRRIVRFLYYKGSEGCYKGAVRVKNGQEGSRRAK